MIIDDFVIVAFLSGFGVGIVSLYLFLKFKFLSKFYKENHANKEAK